MFPKLHLSKSHYEIKLKPNKENLDYKTGEKLFTSIFAHD
jgi:hypothetical protein